MPKICLLKQSIVFILSELPADFSTEAVGTEQCMQLDPVQNEL